MMKKHWSNQNRDASFERWWRNVTAVRRQRDHTKSVAKAAWDAAWVSIIEGEQPTTYEDKEKP